MQFAKEDLNSSLCDSELKEGEEEEVGEKEPDFFQPEKVIMNLQEKEVFSKSWHDQ